MYGWNSYCEDKLCRTPDIGRDLYFITTEFIFMLKLFREANMSQSSIAHEYDAAIELK